MQDTNAETKKIYTERILGLKFEAMTLGMYECSTLSTAFSYYICKRNNIKFCEFYGITF